MPHLLLYGGTFDPIHHGHLITARAAREYLHADTLILLPARLSPHKLGGPNSGTPPLTTPQQRLDMLQLAIENEPHITIVTRELFAPDQSTPSYTVNTVTDLLRDHPHDRLTLLLGSDQLPKLHTWHQAAHLFTLVDVAVLGRPSDRSLQSALLTARSHLNPTAANRLTLLPTPLIDISATTIRQRARDHLPITYLVPAQVATYITTHNLYQ